jgi:chorismate dehydratase
LLSDAPSECARHLSTGEADVGLIPVIEYQRIPGLKVLPSLSISAKHEARSVLFVSKVPLHRVTRIAVDSSSRTSAALLRIILTEFHRLDQPALEVVSPDPERMLAEYDAALLIGNPALSLSRHGLRVYDLAGEWRRHTGLPFVFAFWAAREPVDMTDHARLFYRSLEEGLAEMDTICRIYSERVGIPAEEIRRYLLRNLDYTLDEANYRGLMEFYAMAARLGLIQQVNQIQYCAVSHGNPP